MPDYDVSALALSVPPADASLTTYRPSISVKNNGLYPATATGTISAYIGGRQIFTSNVQSEAIAPGETGLAIAADEWTPDAQGDVMFFGYVTITRDQNQSNGYLPPVTIHVGPEPPTPPVTVPAHVSQHEPGGSDVLIVTSLHGKLADAQTALAHKTSHQVGGSDLLDVTGLPGILAEGQPIADHHEAHENHGGDELNVEGLSGVLYNLQKPQTHANEAHDPNFASSTELSNHLDDTTAVHAAATNLEQTTNKGDPDGYPQLDSLGHVPPAQLGSIDPAPADGDALTYNALGGSRFAPATPAEHGDDKHDETVASLDQNGYVPVAELGVEPQGVEADFVLRHDQSWGAPPGETTDVTGLPGLLADPQRTFNVESGATFGSVIAHDAAETTLTSALFDTTWWTSAIRIRADAYLLLELAVGAPTAKLIIRFKQDLTVLQQIDYNISAARTENLLISAHLNGSAGNGQATLYLSSDVDTPHSSDHVISFDTAVLPLPSEASTIAITAEFSGAPVGTSATKRGGAIYPVSARP